MSFRINAQCRAQLRKTKREDVEQTLATLKPFIMKSRWLGATNRYATNTTNRLPKANRPIQKPRHLAQYIAASSLLHCADGWSFLGRAINCLLNGDPHRAVHFAYYAELRAAFSLLASEGVGVFKNRHFIIDGVNSVAHLKSAGNTHAFTWECFNYWASIKNSGDLFSSVVTPGGIAISDWFAGVNGVERHLQPQARSWFKQWTMDLKQIDDDHNARNDSSYRPDGIPAAWFVSGESALKVVTGIWEACEPSPSSTFENIDRHILRFSTHRAFFGLYGKTSLEVPDKFMKFVTDMTERMGFSDAIGKMWIAFLGEQPTVDTPDVFEYSTKNATDRAVGHAAILSRATFLLRLASGSTQRLVRSAGINSTNIKFWWEQLGLNRGLPDAAFAEAQFLDLWADVQAWIDQLKAFQLATPNTEQSYEKIRSDLSSAVNGMGAYERVALWSLTP